MFVETRIDVDVDITRVKPSSIVRPWFQMISGHVTDIEGVRK
jgi:hypothetical protein